MRDKKIPLPTALVDAFVDGLIPAQKFKLLSTMLFNPPEFIITPEYLSKAFSPEDIEKYMPELESEGFITIERVQSSDGSFYDLHHINSIAKWPEYARSKR